jgi:NAD(P)-dependent dehydrogenase (short-subunit alcohol dehydrogenase family)
MAMSLDMRAPTLGRLVVGGGLAYVAWRLFRSLRTTDLSGQVVLITGGSRGLGLLLARQFCLEGCRVVICARDQAELERATAELENLGGEIMPYRCDVADRERVDDMIAAIVDRFGRIDIVVNNAGIIQVGPFESMTLGDFERAFNVNFWGPLHVVWAALPHMKAAGRGQIVNVTSIGAKVAVPHLLPYDCAKAAFSGLSEGLHAELSRFGIQVTTVVPGLMRTGSPLAALFKGEAEREFEWFGNGDSLRIMSMSPDRAARRIVKGTKRREVHFVMSWQAKLLRLTHALLPSLVQRTLAFVNRLLPKERGLRFESRKGHEVAGQAPRLARRLGEAGQRLNQPGAHAP